LALFEESVQQTAEHLRDGLVGIDDPLERLHRFVVNYYRDCRPPFEAGPDSTGRLRFMAEFAQQLLTAHPKEAARVFAPLVEFFEELLRDAVAAGGIRPDFSDGPIVGIVLEAIMFNTFSSTIAGLSTRPQAGDSAEYLWDLIVHGIGSGSGS
jgi:AcrR family transcriptional regulator